MSRNIKTVYYFGRDVVKVNSACFANNAVPRCIGHMQMNEYSASHAEVYDAGSGELHAVIRRQVSGNITIVFKREVKEGM